MEVQRDGATAFFCVERAIERGEYVKHNNNSGALDFDGVHRATPHIFSRFSFYASAGALMAVDIRFITATLPLKYRYVTATLPLHLPLRHRYIQAR